MDSEIGVLENKLNIKFGNLDLLREAVTHRSYLNENPSWRLSNNERLEFLGDAVLELVVTEELFSKFPDKEEGDLTLYRAALVNSKMLRKVAAELGIDKVILVSKGESKDLVGRGGETLLADAVEAVIGAVYLDQGYEAASKIIKSFVLSRIEEVMVTGGKDPKSMIQEIAQERYHTTPTYKTLEESGPAHNRTFRAGLYFGNELEAEGMGSSKQEAELEAAHQLLKKLRT